MNFSELENPEHTATKKSIAVATPVSTIDKELETNIFFLNDCVENINFTAADSPIATGTYRAANDITTTGTVTANGSRVVTLEAGNTITLSAGFSAQPNASGSFTARIKTCVVGNTAPTVAFIQPMNGEEFAAGNSLSVQVSASDSDGTVTGVELFYDDVSQGVETMTYEWTINNLVEGQRTLRAVATDNSGVTSEATITITVVQDDGTPKVTISTPEDGQVFTEGDDLTVMASATDSDGTIRNIRLFFDDMTVRVIQSDQGTWDANTDPELASLTPGPHEIRVVAVDNQGNTGEQVININVIEAGTPMLSFVTPTDGQVFPNGTSVVVEVNATDSDGSINNVELFLDGNFVRRESIAPYQWGLPTQNDPELANMSPGTYMLKAVATDNEGKMNSDSISFTISNDGVGSNIPPTVSFTTPTDGQTFQEGANLSVEATASDSDGTITGVEFIFDGMSQGTDNTAPYQWTVNNLATGTYTLQVIATDDDNATAQESISITVNPNSGNGDPVVTISTPADGANFPVGTDLTVMASATDADGVKNIRLLLNGSTVRVITGDQGTWDATTDPELANLQAGNYEIKVVAVDNNNNIGETIHNITVGSTAGNEIVESRSFEEQLSESWMIYPNPVRETLLLNLDNFLNEELIVTLRDQIGKVVWSRKLQKLNAGIEEIQLTSSIEAGIYTLTIETANTISHKHLIIAK